MVRNIFSDNMYIFIPRSSFLGKEYLRQMDIQYIVMIQKQKDMFMCKQSQTKRQPKQRLMD